MNELKKKRSRFKQLIETYCGHNSYNSDLIVINLEKDKYAPSVIHILTIAGILKFTSKKYVLTCICNLLKKNLICILYKMDRISSINTPQ